MPTTRTASTAATSPKTHRSSRTAGKKPLPSAHPITELDAGALHQEIAEVAYRNWLERAGSAEQDWLKAEIEVRARYIR